MVYIRSIDLGVYYKAPLKGFTHNIEEAHQYSQADLDEIRYQGEDDARGIVLIQIPEAQS